MNPSVDRNPLSHLCSEAIDPKSSVDTKERINDPIVAPTRVSTEKL